MKRYNKIHSCFIGIMMVIYIGTMVFLNIVTKDRTFSESENRVLEQLPKFSINKLLNDKLTLKYEKYTSDQFAMRDFWIGVKSSVERSIGKKENNGVYLGKDGYLMQMFNNPEDERLKKNIESINLFADLIPNVNKYFMLVPNSTKILEEKLPPYAPVKDQLSYIDKAKSLTGKNINFVDVYDTLNCKKNEYIFYKTDHHWTTKGAYYAYRELSKQMGINPHGMEYFTVNKVTDSFYGSLYSEGGFRNLKPDSIELYIPKVDEKCKVEYLEEDEQSNSLYNMENLNKKDKYTVFFNGNHPLMKITTNTDNNKKLLIIKDSYANSFIPFLTGHYNEIYVVDLRYYSNDLKKLIESNHIQDLLILYNVNLFSENTSISNICEQ